jgi:hypothetical protein
MPNPTFDIQLSTNTFNSRIMCNEVDISDAIHAIRITQVAGEMPVIELELIKGSRGASLRAQCEAQGFIVEKIEKSTIDAQTAPLEP